MRFIILTLAIITFWKATIGSIIFIAVAFLLEIWVIIATLSKQKIKNENNKFTPKEIEIIERYNLFFRFPTACRMLSPMFSAIQISTILLTPWLIFKGVYIQAVIIGLNYFIAARLAGLLNPQFFLHDNLDNNKIKDLNLKSKYTEDMNNIDSALKKIYLDDK